MTSYQKLALLQTMSRTSPQNSSIAQPPTCQEGWSELTRRRRTETHKPTLIRHWHTAGFAPLQKRLLDADRGPILGPQKHATAARVLEHPFDCPPNIPIDLQFAARIISRHPLGSNKMRGSKLRRLRQLAERTKSMDTEIVNRMVSSVKIAAGTLKLGLLAVPTLILRWPDWQMTSLFTRGFRVAGMVEPSNVYPKTSMYKPAQHNFQYITYWTRRKPTIGIGKSRET